MGKKIILDLGHGGKDSGAIGKGLREKDIVLKIGKIIFKELTEKYECSVMRTRSSDRYLTLKERTDMANKWGADLLVSVHVNAGGGTGFESFVYNGTLPKRTLTIQNIIHSEIMKALGKNVHDRGMKKANFHMLRESKMNAFLSENMFIDTKKDADMLKDDKFIKKIAIGHVNGIVKALQLKKKEKVTDKNLFYRVVAGSYKDRANADKQVKELEKKGIKGVFITTYRK